MQKQLTLETTVNFYLTHWKDSYLVLPLRARVDQEVMAMKENSAFPKAPALLEPHHQII